MRALLGPDGAQSLAGVLGQCAALTHFNLGYNQIGPDGADSLGGVLDQCTALAHLHLSSNRIGEAGAKSLAGVLGQCAVYSPGVNRLSVIIHELEYVRIRQYTSDVIEYVVYSL